MYYAISLSEYLLIIHHLIKTNKQTQNWNGHVDHTFAAVDSSIFFPFFQVGTDYIFFTYFSNSHLEGMAISRKERNEI